MSSKLTPEERGRNLEAFAKAAELEEEAKRLPEMTNAEVAASIADSGHDQEAARAIGRRAAEVFAKAAAEAKAKADGSNVVPLPPRRLARWLVPLSAAAAVAALVGIEGPAMLARISESPGTNLVGAVREAGPNEEAAMARRESAFEDCIAKRYADCLRKLDEANALDPDSERAVHLTLRTKALAALAGEAGAAEPKAE